MNTTSILLLTIYSLVWFVAGMITMMIIRNRRERKERYEKLLEEPDKMYY